MKSINTNTVKRKTMAQKQENSSKSEVNGKPIKRGVQKLKVKMKLPKIVDANTNKTT